MLLNIWDNSLFFKLKLIYIFPYLNMIEVCYFK